MTERNDKRNDPYVVIARRFRPRHFEEIVGQEPIVRTLVNEIRENRIPHSWLFAGIRGVGKTTTARILAKALNCGEGPTDRPCDGCPSCTDITAGRSLDVLEIDGASNRGIDQIRELRETVRNHPARDRYRILIIDEVHMLTREAFNALLKTLEEPPAHVRFVLATTELQKVPDTIASRCQVFEFRAMPSAVLERELGRIAEKEKITISPRGLGLLARSAAGSLRDAQGHLDQAIAFCGGAIDDEQLEDLLAVTNVETLRRFAAGIADRDGKALLELVDALMQKGSDPIQFCRDLQAYFRDLILVRNGIPADRGSLLLETDPEQTRLLAERFTEDQLIRIFHLLVRDEPSIRYSTHPRYLLEVLAVKLARLADLTPVEQLIAELRGGEPEEEEGPSGGSGGGGQKSLPLLGGAAEPAGSRGTAPANPALPAVTGRDGPPPPAPEGNGPPPDDAPPPGDGPAKAGPEAVRERIALRLEAKKASLAAFLGQASRVDVDGERIVVVFPEHHSFARQTLEQRDNLRIIREAGREEFGRDLRVEVVEEAEASRDLASPDETNHHAARRDRLLDSAMHEPAVRDLLDTFQGEIVEIRETES